MSKQKKIHENLKKEDVFQAVLIADDFEDLFSGYTAEKSSVLVPVVNACAIDYALECLGRSGVQETILFCCSHADVIKEHMRKSQWSLPGSTMNVTIIVSEKCESLGDAIRDIDNKAVIKGDFVLMSAFSISNLKLLDVLDYHRQQCCKDKGTAMTLIMQDVGSSNARSADIVIAVNATTDRLLLHAKPEHSKKVDIPLEYLLENPNVSLLNNLIDTGITICSPSVPLLFAENFDFQTKEDFIKGLLLNEDVLASRIYCYQVEHGYGATVRDWRTYQRVTNDIIHRWTFPLVPDQPFTNDDPFCHFRNCVYKQPGVQLLNNVNLEMDVVIGKGSKIGNNARILRSVIGKNCQIGENADIRDSYIFDNTVIKDECKINLCVIGENVEIGKCSKLWKCLLKQKVVINKKTEIESSLIASRYQELPIEDDGYCQTLNDQAYVFKTDWCNVLKGEVPDFVNTGLVDPNVRISDDEPELSSESDVEGSYTQSPEPDDTNLFYMEVVDSLQRGYEEKLSCDNLILEINSSRYAYNVTLSDVTTLTVKAVLSLSTRVNSTTKSLLVYFLPLFKNYVKSSEAQIECLGAMEDAYEVVGNDLVKCLHFLYDNDVISEDNILSWHKGLEDESVIKPKLAPLIKWFEEAAEESSSEDSE